VARNDSRDKDRRIQAKSSGAPRASSVDSAFDTWLKGRLQDMFGDAAREPIPREMLQLLQAKSERD